MWGRDTLQGDSTSLRSVPAPPIVSCVPATAGTCIQRAPPPTQVESTSDSEALDLFRRKPYKPITFLTIIQEPFLSEPIRIIIPIFFSAVVALVIVARDTENFCIICLSVILSFSTMALKIICCLLDSWERRIVSFSVSFTVSFRNSDIVGESADAPVDRSRIPSLWWRCGLYLLGGLSVLLAFCFRVPLNGRFKVAHINKRLNMALAITGLIV